jgi:hypothetical protein
MNMRNNAEQIDGFGNCVLFLLVAGVYEIFGG